MLTFDFPTNLSHSYIMAEARRLGWHIMRGKWCRTAAGTVFRVYYSPG